MEELFPSCNNNKKKRNGFTRFGFPLPKAGLPELQVCVYHRLCTTAYSSTCSLTCCYFCASSRERHVWALGSGLVEGRARSGLDLGGGSVHPRGAPTQRSAQCHGHPRTTSGPEKRSFLLLLYPGAAQERPSTRTPGVVVVFLPFPSHLLI